MRRIGIYPGTFDPVHAGHVAFALEAMRACELDEVVFLPERLPREKPHVSDFAERMTLLQTALRAAKGLRAAELASGRFTVHETLPEIRLNFGDAELTLLLGSDVVHTFPYRWEGLDVLLDAVSLAIGMRAGDNPEEIAAILANVAKEHDEPIRHTIIVTDHAHLASSQLRRKS